jgi:hypothetical protein
MFILKRRHDMTGNGFEWLRNHKVHILSTDIVMMHVLFLFIYCPLLQNMLLSVPVTSAPSHLQNNTDPIVHRNVLYSGNDSGNQTAVCSSTFSTNTLSSENGPFSNSHTYSLPSLQNAPPSGISVRSTCDNLPECN